MTLPLDYAGYWKFEQNLKGTVGPDMSEGNGIVTYVPALGGLGDSVYSANVEGGSYITLSSPFSSIATFMTPEQTWSTWFKFDSLATTQTLLSNYIYSGTDGDSRSSGNLLRVLDTGQVRATQFVTTSETYTDSNGNTETNRQPRCYTTETLTSGEWYNIVLTFDQSAKTTSIYINGVFSASITSAQTPGVNTADGLSRGLSFNSAINGQSGVYYDIAEGSLDNVRFYQRVLSASEVLSLYEEYVQISQPEGKRNIFAGDNVSPNQAINMATGTESSTVVDDKIVGTIGTPIGNFNWWEAAAPTCVIDPYWTSTVLLSHFDNLISPNSLKNEKGYPMVSYGAHQNNSNPKIGQGALQFQSGDYIEAIPYPESILSDTAYTLETWIYATEYTAIYGTIFSSSNTYTGGDWFLAVTAAGNLQLSDTEVWTAVHHNTVPLNTWVHVAAVYDNDEMTLYLDGVKGTPTAWRGSWPDTGEPIRMGVLTESRIRPFVGYMDEVRITNAARYSETFTPETTESCPGSTDETPALGFAYQDAMDALNPISYYKLDEESGTLATDLGSLAVDGTYTSMTATGAGATPPIGIAGTSNLWSGDSVVAVPSTITGAQLQSGMSCCYWFHPTGAQNAYYRQWEMSNLNANGGNRVGNLADSGGTLYSTYVEYNPVSEPAWLLSSSNTIPLNTWSFVVYVYESNVWKLYVNGVLDTTWSGHGMPNPAEFSYLHLGLDVASTAASGIKGSISNWSMLDSVLTPTQITDLYSTGITNTSGNLLTNGDFSDGTTGWSTTSPSTIVVTTEQMTISRNSAAWGRQCSQDIVTEIGESYTFSGELISESPGTAKTSIMLDGVENSNWAGADITFVATSTTTTIDVRGAGDSAAVIVVDNLSVIKV